MVLDVTDAEMAHVVERSTQSDGVGHVGCASLETGRGDVVLCTLNGDVLNHVTTTLPGLHLIQELLATIHHTNAVGAIDLMT